MTLLNTIDKIIIGFVRKFNKNNIFEHKVIIKITQKLHNNNINSSRRVNMATPVIMPRQGQSVESCIIVKWHKQKGDYVKAGDILFSYETDKAAFDEEAKVEGTLLEVFFEEGDDVPVLTNVCVIGTPGESTDEFNPNTASDGKDEASAEVTTQQSEQQVETAVQVQAEAELDQTSVKAAESGDIKVSPRAKNLAARTGIDYRFAAPTGPNGRIIERDIIALRENGPVATMAAREQMLSMDGVGAVQGTGLGGRITIGDLQTPVAADQGQQVLQSAAGVQPAYEDIKLSNIRKVIAKSMHHSLSELAQLTLNTSFDATDILNYRSKIKQNIEKLGLENITLNDIILYAVSRTILNHKNINSHFLDDKIRIFNNVHLGIAVDTERGLMVPTLFNADLKSLNQISKEAKALISECQKGTISPDLLKGASFTVTNLGSLGIESFTPVINPPQTAILGVNTIVQRVKEVNGEYKYYPAMGLSLTFDHRAFDGAPAARFLQDLKNNLENFSVLLAK